MRRVSMGLTMAAVMVGAMAFAKVAVAQEADAEEAYQKIKELGDRKLQPMGKKVDDFRKEAAGLFSEIIRECDSFQKRFPGAGQTGEVMYEEARAYLYLSRYSGSKTEHMATAADLATKVVAMDSKTEAAAKSRGILIQYYKMNGKVEEMIEQAEAVVKDSPESLDAPIALRYIAEAREKQGKQAEAFAAWEKLAAGYPDSNHGQRAAGILAFRKLKGAPLDLAFMTTDGQDVDIKTLRGKVVIVFFWSPVDESSTTNLKFIAASNVAMREQGLAVLGVCLESNDEAMRKACAEARADWPEHFDGKKWENDLVVKLGVRNIPTALLVDRKGIVRDTSLLGRPLIDAAKALLAEK